MLYIQGSEIFFPTVNYDEAERYSAAVYGLLVSALPFYMVVRLAKLYRRQHGDGTWAGSIPVAFNLDIAAASRAGREFQVWVVVLFCVLPVFCRFLLLRKLFKASIFDKAENVQVISSGVLEHLCTPYPFAVVFGAGYTIGVAQHGVTYFPFWQSWAHLILEIALWGYMLSFVVSQHRHAAHSQN